MVDFNHKMVSVGDSILGVRLKMWPSGELIFHMPCNVSGAFTPGFCSGSYPEEFGNLPAWSALDFHWVGHPLSLQELAYNTIPTSFFSQRWPAQTGVQVLPDDITNYSLGVTIKALCNWSNTGFVYYDQGGGITMGIQRFGSSGIPNFVWTCAGVSGSTQPPALNIWYEYLISVKDLGDDESEIKVYRDDELIDTQSGGISAPPEVSTVGFFATFTTEDPYVGSLFKDIKIYDYAVVPTPPTEGE